MPHSAETRRRRDFLIELYELGVLDQEELDVEMARLPKPEPEEQTLPSPSG